jgi:alkylated DNA nucleotide flippase Atl1
VTRRQPGSGENRSASRDSASRDGSRRGRGHLDEAVQRPALDDYASRVLDVVDSIAPGTVMSYGDVAEFLGQGGPRQVGRIMAMWGGGVAWWRVVHADGSLLAGHERAALAAYEAESTPMRYPAGGGVPRIDMTRARRRT